MINLKYKSISISLLILLLVAGIFIWYSKIHVATPVETPIVTEPLPSKSTYANASADLIVVDTPFPDAVVGKKFSVIGKARGAWYFEASFPVQVLDKDGNTLWQGPAQAQGDWMTENFVPFKVDIKIPQTYIGKATLVLKKDNPSGLPEHEASISFQITIEY